MYKILKIIFFITFALWIFISKSHSATGAADVYKITMRKVELCTASTGATSCDNAVVIGSGDKVVDIASVSAGSAAASYGDPALLPLGETYTHMRVTIDRKFVIKNSTAIAAGSNATACRTVAATDTMYVTDEATDKYTHKPVVANNQTAAEMNVYLINDQRATLGAISNRLDATVSNLTNIITNTESSVSNIRDADFSVETSRLTRAQILNQAATSMLAQANASKQTVLSLLQG